MPASDGLAALERLRAELTGTLVLPGDAEYDTARLPWNRAIDQRPAAIATPADTADVSRIVRAAADAGLAVTVQPNGHGAAGDLQGVVLVRPTRFDTIAVDEQARILRVGAGVNWGAALAKLEGTGLIALAGSNPMVNAAALSINGGQSMFSRRYGLAARAIVSAEVVDASGTARRITDADDPEVIWALRGGGGHFAIVTELELALYPGERLFGGSLLFPETWAEPVIAAAFALARDVPDLGVDAGMMSLPDHEMVPPPLRGQTVASVALVHVGDPAEGQSYADRLLAVAQPIANTLQPFTIGQLAAVAGEPTDPMPTVDFGGSVDAADDAFAAEFVAAFTTGARSGLGRASFRALGGAIADELGADRAAIGAPQAPALLNSGVVPFGPHVDPAAALAPLRELVARHRGDRGIPSFLGAGTTFADAYPAETIDRLGGVKLRVDPGNVIRANRPLR
ncbi:FAD-binding oxidoreductase [Agromyces protaetiae]|nr:FAD-dependent oxidoreductase [Agromyces protaetiae]